MTARLNSRHALSATCDLGVSNPVTTTLCHLLLEAHLQMLFFSFAARPAVMPAIRKAPPAPWQHMHHNPPDHSCLLRLGHSSRSPAFYPAAASMVPKKTLQSLKLLRHRCHGHAPWKAFRSTFAAPNLKPSPLSSSNSVASMAAAVTRPCSTI